MGLSIILPSDLTPARAGTALEEQREQQQQQQAHYHPQRVLAAPSAESERETGTRMTTTTAPCTTETSVRDEAGASLIVGAGKRPHDASCATRASSSDPTSTVSSARQESNGNQNTARRTRNEKKRVKFASEIVSTVLLDNEVASSLSPPPRTVSTGPTLSVTSSEHRLLHLNEPKTQPSTAVGVSESDDEDDQSIIDDDLNSDSDSVGSNQSSKGNTTTASSPASGSSMTEDEMRAAIVQHSQSMVQHVLQQRRDQERVRLAREALCRNYLLALQQAQDEE